MKFSVATLTFLLPTLIAALPAHESSQLKNFYIITTPTKAQGATEGASAISLFDPYYQPQQYLRKIGPGYLSLPTFNLRRDGRLHTMAELPHVDQTAPFASEVTGKGKELQFVAAQPGTGALALKNGYLLTRFGDAEGWTTCPGDFGEEVIQYRNYTTGCEKVYVQAAAKPPY